MAEIILLSDLHKCVLCKCEDLDLRVCVGNGGQSFSWTVIIPDKLWAKILNSRLVVLEISNNEQDVIFYSKNPAEDASALSSYFRLEQNLKTLYLKFCKLYPGLSDPKKPPLRRGIRIIDQDPFETFISFICSQNNVIIRIKKMVHTLMENFGSEFCKLKVEHAGSGAISL